MALDTAAKRNSALLDAQGALLPDGSVGAADRQTLVGDYLPLANPADDVPTPPGPGAHNLASLGMGG
jgi:hypothetical protein